VIGYLPCEPDLDDELKGRFGGRRLTEDDI
jgi:hypothetical protein